jgi:hypothetical protein
VLEIASWINADEAGAFFRPICNLVVSLVQRRCLPLASASGVFRIDWRAESGNSLRQMVNTSKPTIDPLSEIVFSALLPRSSIDYRLTVISAYILPSRFLYSRSPAPAFLCSPWKSANKIGWEQGGSSLPSSTAPRHFREDG